MTVRCTWTRDCTWRVVQVLLLFLAIGLLGFCGLELASRYWHQASAGRELDAQLPDFRPSDTRGSVPMERRAAKRIVPARERAIVGRIVIPRLGLSAIVEEGTSKETLRRAVGHIRGTALPGQRGNTSIAGHRDTFFRKLKHLEHGDDIEFQTAAGFYRYRVDSLRVVQPTDVLVLAPTTDDVLTMITCYPFEFIGDAPKRFVARASRQ